MTRFLQKNPNIKRVEFTHYKDYKNLVKVLELMNHDVLSRIDQLICDVTKEETQYVIQPLAEIGRSNIGLTVGIRLEGVFSASNIKVLVETKGFDQIKYLDLSLFLTRVSIEGVRALAGSEKLQELKHLDLGDTRMNDDVAKFLSESQYMRNLEHLGLNGCGTTSTEFLADSSMEKLRYLDLRNNKLSLGSIERLASFPHMLQLESLYLPYCTIEDAKALSQMENLKSLTIDFGLSPRHWINPDPSVIEKLVERKFDYLDLRVLKIESGTLLGFSAGEFTPFGQLIMAAQSAREMHTILDADTIKKKVFAIARYDHDGKIIQYILGRPDKYPFLINSRFQGNSLMHFYNNKLEMQEFLFSRGMIPELEGEREGNRLREIARNSQSVHFKEPIERAKFFTKKLVERIGSDNDRIEQAVDSYVSDLSELNALYRSDSIRERLFSLTVQEIKDIKKFPESGLKDSNNKKAFIDFIFYKAKEALNTVYLKKSEGQYEATHEEVYDDSGAKITIPESIGYVKLLIDTYDPLLKARKDLLIDLAAENPGLIEQKLPEIRSKLGNNDISLEQITDRSRFHELLQDIDGDKVDSLFKQISDLNIKEIWREQAKIALLKKIFEASLVGGPNAVSCSQGAWSRIIASVDQIDPEFTEEYSRHLGSVWQEVQRSNIDKAKGKEIAESLAQELVKHVRKQPKLKEALNNLFLTEIDSTHPEQITLEQQQILAKINQEFIQRYLGNNQIPKNADYQMVINGFFGNKEIDAFIELEKISEQIKALDEQGRIARNKERLKIEVKKLIEEFKENDIDINAKNSEGETLLHLAARIDDKSLVSDLLNKGAVFNVRNKGNLTPKDLSKSEEVLTLFTNAEQAFYTLRFQAIGCTISRRRRREVGRCIFNANEYIERLRELPTQKQISFTRANEIDFTGSAREVGQAEKVRDLLRSETMTVAQKSYKMDELFKNPREERILDLSEDSKSGHSMLKQRLMNAAGRIQLARGIHSTLASCGDLSTDCMLSVGEMGFSFLSQPIESRMLKITPRVVKSAASVAGKAPVLGKSLKFAIQLKGMKFGAPIARGVAGGIGGVFDIVDIGMSANTLIICLRKREEGEEPCSDMEIRDSIAGITFGSVSFISGVAFTALGMSGAGTVVGLALMVGQAVYSGISTIIEYEEKYDTTHDENWRIFWHRVAFQPIPQDVQDLAARTETVNQLAKEAWKRLANSTDVVAIAMGLGNVTLRKKIVGRLIHENSDGLDKQTEIEDGNACTSSDWEYNPNEKYYRSCFNMAVQVPHILPGHASIKMNETSDTTKLSRIVPASPSPDAQMLGLPKWSGQEYEYIDKGVEGIVDSAKNPALSSNPVGSLVSGIVAAVAVAVGSFKPLHKAPHYSENPEAIYPCDNAFVIANRTRIANDDKNQTILFDLRYVKEGEVIGSNKWKNAFLVHDGHVQIFGGNNTHNTFHLMNETVSGGVFGGKNASNLLDFSLLNSMTILYSVGGIYGLVYSDDQQRKRKRIAFTKLINHVIGRQGQQEGIGCNDNQKMFVNSGGGYNNDRKDWLTNCKKAVISPYTEATGGDGNYIFYIKPSNILEAVGRSEIDVSGNGTLVFPETALLKDCRIIHSTSNNTLSFEIPLGQNKTFVLEVKNYLNEDQTPKFHLIDKHGSNIVPIIGESESKEDPAQIKSFRLNAEKEAFKDIEEDEAWYRGISQSHEDYQVFGVIKDKQSKQKRIFGNSGTNIIDMSGEAVFAQGRNGSDVYHVNGNVSSGRMRIDKIDNCAEDQEPDILLYQQHSLVADRIDDSLYLYRVPDENGLRLHKIIIKDYFKDPSCQHLIVNTDDEMLIPFNLGGKVRLVPFYHASNSENVFFLPENSTEFVIDAKMEDTEFYRYKGHLLLIRDKDDDTMIPLTIIVKDFYFDQSKWQSVKPYFWNRGEFASFDLSQKAESYEDKIKSDYEKIFKDYVYTEFSEEIAHNQQLENGTLVEVTESEKRIGILIFRDIDPSRIGLVYSDNNLILFDNEVDHKNLTVQNWNTSKDYRISRVEFDLESGRVVINKLDRFDLSAEGIERMKDLFYRAKTNGMIDRSLKTKSEIANNFQCLITMYGLYKGSNTYKCLGFLVLEDQINFAKAYCNSQKLDEFTDKVLKDDQFGSLLTQFIIKLYNNLLLNGYSREETARCSNIVLYEQFSRSTDTTKKMQSIRNITNTMNSEIQAQLSTTTVSPEHSHRHHHEHRNATAQQRNRRAIDKNIPSSASRPKPWIKTAFDFATKGIAKLGALIFSSSTASLPVEHPTLSSQQGSTRNSNVTTIVPQINVDGTILLLDVFIRKITGEKYVSSVNQDVSLLEIQADALNITEEFGKILSTTFNTPAEELIDLPEVQSKIFKAMMSGRGNEILGILCPYVKEANLEPEVTKKILSTFQSTKPTASTLESQTKHLSPLPNASYHNEPKSCLSDIKMTDFSNSLACR